MGQMRHLVLTFAVASIVGLFTLVFVAGIEPNGATLNPGTPGRATTVAASSNNAWAGNVTEITISGSAVTQAWQGYFGNISGTITLSDSSNNILYNWTLADPSGEVYASTNQTFTWTNVQCFNFTANQTYDTEDGNGGTTNIQGTNLTGLESLFGIGSSDTDGINQTFNLIGSGTHDAFTTAGQSFSEGECPNTRVFDSTGIGVSNNYEEAILYEPNSTSVIFASILESGSVTGFNDGDQDFEMIVLEDGHGADIATTAYFFFIEIE